VVEVVVMTPASAFYVLGLPGLCLPVLAIALPPMDGFFLQCTSVLCAYFPEKKTNFGLPLVFLDDI